jgi:hypothetical protein
VPPGTPDAVMAQTGTGKKKNVVFWVVTQREPVGGCQRFGGRALHLQGGVVMILYIRFNVFWLVRIWIVFFLYYNAV